MSTDLESYRRKLVLALRLRDVPGAQIAQAVAEVESHIEQSGERPDDTFGSPRAYADDLAAALG
ncbi:MAG: hypothetical protein ACYDH5_18200 [Acidimicrobiales bacterium]